MGMKEPSFTLGVEEEYLLVDKETRGLVIDPPETLMAEAEEKCGAQVTSELLRSQIEVGTRVCSNIQEVREDLSRLRRNIIDVAGNHGLAPIAASTHPFSEWSDQKHTEKDRYDQLTHDARDAGRRTATRDLRHACARWYRRRRTAYRSHEPDVLFSATPACLVVLVAVLDGSRHRA
jgi:carboxylate-amine ligase